MLKEREKLMNKDELQRRCPSTVECVCVFEEVVTGASDWAIVVIVVLHCCLCDQYSKKSILGLGFKDDARPAFFVNIPRQRTMLDWSFSVNTPPIITWPYCQAPDRTHGRNDRSHGRVQDRIDHSLHRNHRQSTFAGTGGLLARHASTSEICLTTKPDRLSSTSAGLL